MWADLFLERMPAVETRPVVHTIGAEDALFSALLHDNVETPDPYHAIACALVFAAQQIGTIGTAEFFLSAAELEEACHFCAAGR